MRIKDQTIYDLNSDQIKYLRRDVDNNLHRVDINVLNKRLNIAKKSNLYGTILVATICFSGLAVLSIISIIF